MVDFVDDALQIVQLTYARKRSRRRLPKSAYLAFLVGALVLIVLGSRRLPIRAWSEQVSGRYAAAADIDGKVFNIVMLDRLWAAGRGVGLPGKSGHFVDGYHDAVVKRFGSLSGYADYLGALQADADIQSHTVVPELLGIPDITFAVCEDPGVWTFIKRPRHPLAPHQLLVFGYEFEVARRLASTAAGDAIDFVHLPVYPRIVVGFCALSAVPARRYGFRDHEDHARRCICEEATGFTATDVEIGTPVGLSDDVRIEVLADRDGEFDIAGITESAGRTVLAHGLPEPPGRIGFYCKSRIAIWDVPTPPDADPVIVGWHVDTGIRYALPPR